jgi:two-component system, chemotaxis family, protein-glutamate methylesterase/glutaminase
MEDYSDYEWIAEHHRAKDLSAAFPMVGIGMSSGGAVPLKTIFRGLSPTTGMAFIVIHHVRKIPTLLPEILSHCTVMAVQLASAGLAVEANHVYVLPSGTEMTTKDGFFSVRPRSKLSGWSNVFTIFLSSLAESRNRGIAVVLSGLDGDGAAALEAFHRGGGITIVQLPGTAERPQMPLAAIETGYVDYVLPPNEIAGQLEKIAEDLKGTERS